MKKIVRLICIAFFAAPGIILSGCAPTQPNEQDTTILVVSPSSLSLTATDTTNSSNISLSCGCQFGPSDTFSFGVAPPLTVTGYGDTSVIHFSFPHPLDSQAYFHMAFASIFPDTLKSPGSSKSWIAFYFLDEGKFPLYDTVRVSANY